jgi:hypothetical protein
MLEAKNNFFNMIDKENIRKLKSLAEEISVKEQNESKEKEATVSCLKKIQEMLLKPRVNKQQVLEELKCLITALS